MAGWLDRRRDLGNLTFLDLRDREGVVQVVASPEHPETLRRAKQARPESVLAVTGTVLERSENTVNRAIPTGNWEIRAERLEILNTSKTPPFPLHDEGLTSEETRLRYRYLDLRRPRLQANLRLRHRVALEIRKFLDEEGFLEIETPILTKSTPEGARDYLVPSRIHSGHFYALPQSPQLFKQLLMVAGFDKYFQIVRCFRDEDLRSDRQPEFTQVDIEMSFLTMDQLFDLIESLLERIFALAGISISRPFPRMNYDRALSLYGTDRPDTRFELPLSDVSPCFRDSGFQIFQGILEGGGTVQGICLPEGAIYSRKQVDDLAAQVQSYGAAGLAWLRRTESGLKSSLPAAIASHTLEQVAQQAGVQTADLYLMVAGDRATVQHSLGQLRTHLAQREGLISSAPAFLWVHDFPLVQWDETQKRFSPCHHPFTAPCPEDVQWLGKDPTRIKAQAYDLVLNGLEIGGGSIRMHQPDLQDQVFQVLGIGPEEAQAKFGFFLEALRHGAPPHGGIALGLDRIAMLLAGENSIREVIAFPKTARAIDLMCQAPSTVTVEQLRELHIRVEQDD